MADAHSSSCRFVVPIERDGIRTNLRFSDDANMARVVDGFRRNGWTVGDAVALPRHELAVTVGVLRPNPGDVVVIRHRRDASAALVEELCRSAEWLQYRIGGTFVLMAEGESLELLDEAKMRAAGWERVRPDVPVVVEAAGA